MIEEIQRLIDDIQQSIKIQQGKVQTEQRPDDAENIRCHTHFNMVSYLIKFEAFEIKLPKGKWTRISTTKDITEEQAESIVEKPEYGWYLTYTKGNMDSYHSQTAKESLQSLIQANKLDINKNYLILKKL